MIGTQLLRLRTIICALALALLLAACAPSSPAGAPSGAEGPSQKAGSPAPAATALPTEIPAPSPTAFTCQEYDKAVALLVDQTYLRPLESELEQFTRDLCRDGYQTIIRSVGYETPQQIRAVLQDLYFQQTGETLAGAILIGDLPHAYEQVKIVYNSPDIPPKYKEFIALQYYADLDGEFSLSGEYQPLDGIAPLGEPMFDTHQGEIDWEIWVSVLPPYLDDQEETVAALQRYFAKNHAYRTGEIDLPRTYLYITSYEAPTAEEHEEFMVHLREGNLNWSALAREGEPLLYFNSPTAGLAEEDGYQALSEGRADFTLAIGHGHEGAVLQITIPWLDENALNTIFFWTQSCYVGNLDKPFQILSRILYHPDSLVLFTTGNTTEAMGMGTNQDGPHPLNISSALRQGASIGEAILAHINVPLAGTDAANPDLTYGPKIFYGDLTLTLRP